jgi:hypothetical protein
MSSYLGRGLEQVDNISKLDNLTFNGGTTYALTKDSAAFTPISSNAILISIDGVIQQGNFSVSGTNIVFNFSPTGSNTCDFIMHYGTGVAFTPADNSITKDKTNFVSTSSSAGLEIKGDGTTDGYIQLNCSQGSHGIKLKSPNHASSSSYTLTFPATDPAANKMLQTDGSGNLSFVDAPSGAWTLLETESTASGSAAIFTSMSSAYHTHVFVFDLVRTTTDDDTIRLMVQNSSGDTEQIYGAREYLLVDESGNTSTGTNGSTTSNPHNFTLFGGLGSGANEGFSGFLYFTGTQDANDATLFHGSTINFDHNNKYTRFFHHGRISNSVLPNIRFYGGSGNFEHGNIYLYGIK